ncbi:hypothetical protein [Nannocystis sp.]|uniref:hypothetical protein n=1 Tax=Nannocystis sp. TaxID=1962667 RepID=UPI0024229618|nr:hypothetical protein [Nannocystis sp.]MBK7826391.1 hypothetical protein [Nannocystis sp.]MBK9757907.1 hypothetical protein [Nannocystis sp.]
MRSRHALSLLPLLPALAITAACGDDTGRDTETAATITDSGLTPATVTDSTESNPTSSPTTPTEGSASSTVASGVSDSENTSGVATGTSDPTATTTGASATTDNSTGPVSGSTSVGESTMACACTPGEAGGCEGDQQLVCSDDCTGFVATPCAMGQVCKGDACVALFCQPGEKVCEGEAATKTCNAQGEAFDPPVNCADSEGCSVGQCTSLCLIAEATPSSVGCSFFAQRMDNYSNNANDSMIVGNVSKTKAASVQFYVTPVGGNVEQAQGGPVVIMPGKTATFQLATAPFNKVSGLRKGGSYRIQSTIPVVAYQHSPIGAQATNDASMLLPEHALKTQHIVASYKDGLGAYPSYFSVIASADNTTVSWTPPQNTQAGTGVPAVAAGQTGQVLMNRFDTMEVRVGNGGDISGAFVSSDKPIWVVGAVNCVNVPNGVTFCDHIEEQMLPLDYWGKKYVGAHSPKRGSEKHYYRVFAGEDATTITTTPAQPGTPIMLNKGQWKEIVIPNNTSFIFESDKPFLPVQYLEGQDGGAGTGDPASYQMIPVEQFLASYAFATGTGYTTHYAQIIRQKGGADVKVDGVVVNGYYAVGEYEVADWKISEGGHLAESDANFGVTVVGYTGVTSYAYPGGLQLAVINPQ